MAFHPTQSLTEQIADHLSKEIITGELGAGQRIQELRIAKSLQVSRGSVREALLVLASRHLIDLLPRRGAVVRDLDRKAITHVSELVAGLVTLLFERAERERSEAASGALSQMDAQINRIQESIGDSSGLQLLDAKYGFIAAAFPLANDVYLEEVLRNLFPAAQRVSWRALRNERYDRAETVEFARTLRTIVAGQNGDTIATVVANYFKREADAASH
jgi:DNA-binding GntR family transcriptional regulator